MSYLNKKRNESLAEKKIYDSAHKNFMGGTSFDINNPLLRLSVVAASCFFGEPQYYKSDRKDKRKRSDVGLRRSGISDKAREYLRDTLNAIDDYEWRNLTPVKTIEKCIDEALRYNAEETLKIACDLRNIDNMRVTPQAILIRAANHPKVKGTGLIRKYAKHIIKRGDEPATGLSYQLAAYGKPIPNSLKRSWSDFLKNANEYTLSKYRMENRDVKTVDVIRLAGAFGDNTLKLLDDKLKLNDDGRETWESMRSAGRPWKDCIDVMGHMALLRNIRNFIENKVHHKYWLDKLVGTAADGRQIPFRYYSAYRIVEHIASSVILDGLEECLTRSMGNLPRIEGRNLILVDNSGSAQSGHLSVYGTSTVSHIGNLMGVITGMVSDEGIVGVFGDRLKMIPIRKKSSIFDQLKTVEEVGSEIGGATENGIWLAFSDAIKNKVHWDNIFVYSDMQAGHGGLYGLDPSDYNNYRWLRSTSNYIDVPKLVKEYRNKVNRNVNVFLCQIAGYEDSLLPENYERTFILGGWSEGIIQFAAKVNDIFNNTSSGNSYPDRNKPVVKQEKTKRRKKIYFQIETETFGNTQ